MIFTKQQIRFFETFGFVVLRGLMKQDEMDLMREESEDIMRELRGGKDFDGKTRQAIQPFFERRPFLHSLLGDERINDIGEELCGPDFVLDVTEGNLHVGDTQWHGSYGAWEPVRWIKIGFYLESLRADNGCLRFVPGSHILGDPDYYSVLRDNPEDPDTFRPFGVKPSEVPCYPVECEPGDVIVFVETLLHASFGGRNGRHQHAINFFEKPKTEEQIKHVKAIYANTTYSLRAPISDVESSNTRIRRMVSGLLELGFETTDV